MKILPTRIPDTIYSLENTISKKQNKHLWIIFVPSNILNTNQLYMFQMYTRLSALLIKHSNDNQHSLWTKKESLEEFPLLLFLPSGIFQESLCHKPAHQATFKNHHQSIGALSSCFIGHMPRFRKSIFETIHLTFLKCA